MLLLFIKAAFIFLSLIIFVVITNPNVIKRSINHFLHQNQTSKQNFERSRK